MKTFNYDEAIDRITTADPRYDSEAYHFLRDALDHTIKKMSKPARGPARHVSGQELLEGIRDFALSQFGPMAKTVFNRWGIQKTDDFGSIVFNLVEAGVLGKNEKDSKDDFRNGFDFEKALRDPFKPKQQKKLHSSSN